MRGGYGQPSGEEQRPSILPVGTVTFVAADPGSAAPAGARGDDPARSAIAAHGGVEPEVEGDAGDARGVVGVFGSAGDAVAAALAMQRAVAAGVRVAVHTGEALVRDGDRYTGTALRRCVRLRDLAHAGQTLVSSVTASIVADGLPEGSWLRDLGPHRLRDLSRPEQVFELATREEPGESRRSAEFPPLRSLDAATTNLPVQLTSFVGRRDELAAVELLLDGEQLVTLTGAGGCGKTRLALQAAAELTDRWPDGVWWIDLGPVTDPALVAELVASTVGVLVEPAAGPLRALALQLRDRRLLICLDNCEHLLDACAGLCEGVLRACPDITLLATSREPLAVPGETVWRVPSLADDEAVALFVDRASRVRPWFTLDATNETAVRTLCERLDGIPLALELAAAWLRTLTPAQIAAGLDDRFALLVRGPRGAVPRQQTLAASMDWSHDLLADVDRVVFRRLATFAGSFTLEAARAVCADSHVAEPEVLTALGRLVDKSLVVVDERDGEARYRLLETIRQYAHDRLDEAGESATARDRHLDHYVALAEAAEPHLTGAAQDAWLDRLETEHDNFRAALRWGLALPDPERGRRLAAPLFWLWYLHGHPQEGIDFLRRAIDRAPDDRTTVQSTLLTGVAAAAIGSRQFALIVEYAQRGLEVASAIGDDRDRGRCLLLLGVVRHYLDFDAAHELLTEAGRAGRAADDAFVTDRVRVMEGVLASLRDRHAAARPLLQDGLDRCRRRGDRGFAALALDYQVDAAMVAGDLATAERLAAEALEVAGPLADYFSVGLATSHLAFVRGLAGDLDAGRRLMAPLVRSVEGADDIYVPRMATVLGRLCLWGGAAEAAVSWFERDVRYEGPMAQSIIVVRALPGLVAALRRLGRLRPARAHVDRALDLSRRLDMPHVLAEALDQSAFLVADDDPDQAEELHHQALATRVDYGLRLFQVDSLDALAAVAARAESHAEAVRLLAASDAARTGLGYPRPPADRPDHEAALAGLRLALGDDGFAAAWADGSALTLEDAVAYVRRARGSRGRPSTGWASLTPTELGVARLVAEGLTNPEIATRLIMSRATVKTHLSHVYAKLGIANRVELATLASARSSGE